MRQILKHHSKMLARGCEVDLATLKEEVLKRKLMTSSSEQDFSSDEEEDNASSDYQNERTSQQRCQFSIENLLRRTT